MATAPNSPTILRQKGNVTFRYLQPDDYALGLQQTLNQLTKTSTFEKTSFHEHFKNMEISRNRYLNIVGLEENKKIVAFGTCIVTQTLRGRTGKIENIVVCKSTRGKGLGKDVIELLKDEGIKNGADTITLFCEDKNVEFYVKLGFMVKGTLMVAYA